MDAIIHSTSTLHGTVTVPPDKAIGHRAALVAALAQGETEIRPWPSADDCQRTLQLVRDLGLAVRQSAQSVWIRGGLLRPPTRDLFCGESGTTLRLAAGLLAGQPFRARLTAGPSLSQRPMRRILEPLAQMGAAIEGAVRGEGSAERYPPLTVQGRRPLRAIRYELPVASAQVKSAILLAALAAEGATTVIEPAPTRDHTERMLERFGVRIERHDKGIAIQPGPLTSPGHITIPGDVSSAAFFVVAAACVAGSHLSVQAVGLNPTRTAWLSVLKRMGASITTIVEERHAEPSGRISVEHRPLHAVTVEADEVSGLIDELPILMVAAACATGVTRLNGVGELRVKETDRIHSMVTGLARMGARIRVVAPDAVEIEGGALAGAEVESAGDHRSAMSLAVAGLCADGATTVQGADCVGKSFPDFFERLQALVGPSTVKTIDKP